MKAFVWIIGVLALLFIMVLVGDKFYREWRDQRDLLIRNRDARKFGFVAYERSAKEKRL
jgi:hypothetical protein